MTDDLRPDPDSATLARYLLGECAREESDEIRRWIDADPARGEMVASLRAVWDEPALSRPALDVDAFWGRIATEIETPAPRIAIEVSRSAPAAPAAQLRERFRAAPVRWWLVGVAAAVVVAAVGGGIALDRLARDRTASVAAAPREFTTARGQRLALRLADGTQVVLGPASRLTVPAAYGAADRAVRLDGEAYFDVTHDAARPFAVRAKHAVARDLGTRFTVRARDREAGVRVVVAEGKVALGAGAQTSDAGTVLLPGDLGRIDAAGRTRVAHGVDVAAYLGWTDGTLVFDRTPFAEAVDDLARWYDVDIDFDRAAFAGREVTVSFTHESLNQVLDAIAFIARAQVTRAGTRIVLSPAR